MQLTFTVNTKAPVATKGLAGVDANSLMVLAYDTEGNFISELPILKTTQKDSKVKFLCNFNAALPVTSGADNAPSYKFVVLTNSTNQQYGMSYDSNGVPQIDSLDFAYPFQSTVPMWGVKTYKLKYGTDGKVLETQDLEEIDVLRSAAKVGVRLSDDLKAEGYKIKDIKINYVSGSGYSVPANWNTVAATNALTAADGFRPASGVSLTDVSAFSISEQAGYEGMHYIYIPEIKNDEELAMAITFLKDGEEIPFTYENGIKFRTYLEGMPTDEKFNVVRNHFYDYRVTAINTSIELEMIEYETLPWIPEEVEVGGEVKYLVLNTDLVKIYSENVDATTLKFTSSSPIASVVLKDVYSHDSRDGKFEKGSDAVSAYYVGKFGQKTQLGTDPGFTMPDKEAALAKERVILANISADAEQNVLQGGITITSPFMADPENETVELQDDSHYNTVRYLEFEVTNQQGLTETFRVEQYPSTVITNIQGYFSYRTDQKFSDDQGEASHYHNYLGWKSFHLTGLMWGYEYDWTNVPDKEDEDWYFGNSAKNYSAVIDNPNAVVNKALCEVIHYGNLGAPHSFVDNRGITYSTKYGGLHKSTTPPTDAFLRHRYYAYPGGQTTGIYSYQGYSFNSKKYDYPRGDIQGLAVGPYYERDGRVYRKQFVWNIQPIFYNLYVSKVYDKDEGGKLKGQADLNSMTYSVTMEPGIMDGQWVSWGKQSYTNHRMYVVRTTTTTPEFNVGYPVLDAEGVTENTESNANVVSPKFAVASQLGETRYQSIITLAAQYNYKVPVVGEFYKLAVEHCREYVETTFIDKDGDNTWDEGETVIHYDDWRLPTKAEINAIIRFQENSRAMDRLLIGQFYFCAAGGGEDADINVEENWVSNAVNGYTSTGYYIRCVRDVYED